jgi:hypothetical protein
MNKKKSGMKKKTIKKIKKSKYLQKISKIIVIEIQIQIQIIQILIIIILTITIITVIIY